jgi:hypothetical protein
MRQFPFSRAPDSFFFMLPSSGSGISVRAFESPWGITDEMLCYADGVLVGRLATNSREPEDRIVIDLLPRLDPRRQYDWPSSEEFCQTLLALILSVPGASVHCERDTEQEPVPRVFSEDGLVESVKNVLAFCVEGSGLAQPSPM